MANEKILGKLLALPAPDFMHAHKLGDPLGSGSSYRADTVVRLIELAVLAERERCAKVCEALERESDDPHDGAFTHGEGQTCADRIREA